MARERVIFFCVFCFIFICFGIIKQKGFTGGRGMNDVFLLSYHSNALYSRAGSVHWRALGTKE